MKGSLLWLCLGSAGLMGCGSDAPDTSATTEPATQSAATPRAERCPSTPRTPADAPVRDARVYVDVSGSMRGFTARSARRLSSVHQAIVDGLTEVGARPERCLLGASFDCSDVPSTLVAFDDPRTYTAPSSRIDTVLRRVPAPERVDPDHPPEPDTLDSTGLTVIVTDGMQVANTAGGDGAACAAGGDPHCIASLLAGRVREGYAFQVVQQMLAFEGPHFAERTLGPEHLEQTRAHLEAVRFESRYNGIEFAATRLTMDSRTGHHSFAYTGVKPLLFFVLGRDSAQVARFTNALVRELRQQPIHPGQMRPEDATEVVAVAPLPDPSVVALLELSEAPADAQQGLRIERLREMRIVDSSRSDTGLRAELWCGANGAHFYQATYSLPSERLPAFVTEAYAFEGPAGALPPRAATPATPVDGAPAFRFGLNCTALPAGRTALGFELVRTTAVVAPEALASQWWYSRSGSSPYETPELPYGLRDVVLRALEAQTADCTVHGRLVLNVQREGA
ncbi:MAG: hypothetical protein H6716_23385 [Polyangiaceae bacterium]|nr:hypothetical protein [Polyangiaceae bacterium]